MIGYDAQRVALSKKNSMQLLSLEDTYIWL